MTKISIKPPSTVHLIGICGTGMGALAGLLVGRGYKVTGSDAHAYPPMSTELQSLGIDIMEGYRASNLDHKPDLVVVGNVCRADHPEAVAAREQGLRYASMPTTVRDLFLTDRRSLVVAGTHGKTTTTSLLAYLLEATGRDPSVLVGGVTVDFGSGQKLGAGPDFVIEGDEYDSAYFEKVPKFVSYAPHAAIITSVEHDHIDIYPTADSYFSAFEDLVQLVNPGPIAVFAGDEGAMRVTRAAPIEVIPYAIEGDPGSDRARWIATELGDSRFGLSVDGNFRGEFSAPMAGAHNLRNILGALILASGPARVPLDDLRDALPGFGGIARRQQLVASPRGIAIYDDFAHHPTAVRETLKALASKHESGRLAAAFEPRSATACRRLHQDAYAEAFDGVGLAIIAPVGRDLPSAERLDTDKLAEDLRARGIQAMAAESVGEIVAQIVSWAKPGDGVAILSNGSFGGIHGTLAEALK